VKKCPSIIATDFVSYWLWKRSDRPLHPLLPRVDTGSTVCPRQAPTQDVRVSGCVDLGGFGCDLPAGAPLFALKVLVMSYGADAGHFAFLLPLLGMVTPLVRFPVT
jgi:hypothetical protein